MRTRKHGPYAPTGEQGFIVLGMLIVVVVTVVVGVTIGKVVHRNRFPPLEVPLGVREARYAVSPMEVRYGAVVSRYVDVGETLWVRASAPGHVVVFEEKESPRIVGYAPDSLLSDRPTRRDGMLPRWTWRRRRPGA